MWSIPLTRSLTILYDIETLCPNSNITQMKWGSAFADMCYKEKVKLVNYPQGLKAMGTPGGLQSVSGIEKSYLTAIVSDRIQFWQQEARAMSRQVVEYNEEEDAASLWADDSVEVSTSKRTELRVENLVRFVRWSDGQFQLFRSSAMRRD